MKDVKEIAKNNVITNYVRGCFYELTKVTWPTKNQAVRLTIIVLGFCLVFAVFLAGVDFFANEGYMKVLDWAFRFAASAGQAGQ
ncbi:MAG: preprotein translocase subunit SecE [Candidatus Gracilibacteria bacterium]